jgi:hypothetical protein
MRIVTIEVREVAKIKRLERAEMEFQTHYEYVVEEISRKLLN